MPTELIGLIEPNHYHALMGFAGVISAFVVLMIWSRGL